jgi:tetratricopeptide (TPR) repeat protein
MKNIILHSLYFLLLAALSPNLYAQTAKEWFEKGLATSDYEEKIRCYTQAIEKGYEPLAKAYYWRGVAKYALDYSEYIADFDKAIQLDPNYAEAYYWRGDAKHALGKYSEAIANYDKAIQLDPNYAKAYYWRGEAKRALGKYSEAIADYDKAFQLAPNDAKTIQSDPNYARAYYGRGNTKYQLGKYSEAIADFDKAIQVYPHCEAYNGRGEAKHALGKYSEAIADFDKAIESSYPFYAIAYYNRGKAYFDMGNYAQAMVDYDRGKELGRIRHCDPPYKYRDEAVAKLNSGTADHTPPSINISEPSVDTSGLSVEEVASSQITIRGRATDASGISSISINGSNTNVGSDGSFSATVNLSEGNNRFTVCAMDQKANIAKEIFSVRRKTPKKAVVYPVAVERERP